MGILRALGQSGVAGCRVLGISGAEYPAPLFLEADGCLHFSQLVRKGNHVGQMTLTPGRGQGIDALGERDSWWRVSDTGRLGVVVVGREEIILQFVETRVGLLHKGNPAVTPGLWQFLLGDGDQAGVPSVANGAVAELGVCRNRTKQDEGACNVGDLVRVVDADAATDEEIDDACGQWLCQRRDPGGAPTLVAIRRRRRCSLAHTFLEDTGRRGPFAAVRLNGSLLMAGLVLSGLGISLGLGLGRVISILFLGLVVAAALAGSALLVASGDGDGSALGCWGRGPLRTYLVTVSSKVVCTLWSTLWAFSGRGWSASSSLCLSPALASLGLVMFETGALADREV